MAGIPEEEKKGPGKEEVEKQTEAQMHRARVNDYVAIALALGMVLLLWFLQWMGLY